MVYVETLLDCGFYRIKRTRCFTHRGHKEMSSILADQWRPLIWAQMRVGGLRGLSQWVQLCTWNPKIFWSSVADPDFFPSRIPDPKTATKERGEEKIFCHTFLCSHKFHKIENYFSFEVLKKKIWANFQFYRTFTQKIVTKLSKIWLWDPGSGIWKKLFRIPDPGVKKAPDPGSRSATLLGCEPSGGKGR